MRVANHVGALSGTHHCLSLRDVAWVTFLLFASQACSGGRQVRVRETIECVRGGTQKQREAAVEILRLTPLEELSDLEPWLDDSNDEVRKLVEGLVLSILEDTLRARPFPLELRAIASTTAAPVPDRPIGNFQESERFWEYRNPPSSAIPILLKKTPVLDSHHLTSRTVRPNTGIKGPDFQSVSDVGWFVSIALKDEDHKIVMAEEPSQFALVVGRSALRVRVEWDLHGRPLMTGSAAAWMAERIVGPLEKDKEHLCLVLIDRDMKASGIKLVDDLLRAMQDVVHFVVLPGAGGSVVVDLATERSSRVLVTLWRVLRRMGYEIRSPSQVRE